MVDINSKIGFFNNGIPKIIHQIWITFEEGNKASLPEHWKKSPEEWKKLHPDYVHIIWNKETSRDFVEQYFPEYLHTYDNFKHVVQKCDMIRYCVLYKIGGIYCDMDNYPLVNIEDSLKNYGDYDTYFAELKIFYSFTTANNNLIFSKPNNELFIKILDNIKDNAKYSYISKTFEVKATNGIDLINIFIKNKKYNICILPYQKFNPYGLGDDITENKPESLFISTKGGSWYSSDMIFIIFLIKNWLWILIVLIILIIFICYFCKK
jgi:mannosyltransferase OCH1-like enzyme